MRGGEKTCPFCAETIKVAAKVCKHCGKNLSMNVDSSSSLSPPTRKKRGCLRYLLYIVGALFIAVVVAGLINDVHRKVDPEFARQQDQRMAAEKAKQEEQERVAAAANAERKTKEAEEERARLAVSAEKRATEEKIRLEKEVERQAQQAKREEERKAEEAAKQLARAENLAKLQSIIDIGIETGVIQKIDETRSTIWVNPLIWRASNRDEKESLINLAGMYFAAKENRDLPYGYVKSFSNDELLGETKMFGGVEIYK